MAAKVRHLLNRDGRFWARLAVPAALRSRIGKRELLTPLGSDRREALRHLPAAIADMVATIEAARARVPAPPPPRSRPLFPLQVARAHYNDELALDTARRDAGLLYLEDNPEAHAQLFRGGYRKALAKVAAGHASQDEAAAAIGWAIDGFIERGNINVTPGSPQWQHLARTLAGIQLEVLARQDERDAGNDAGEPKHPALIDKQAPKSDDPFAARRISPDSELTLEEVKARYIKERGAALTISHEFDTTVRMFNEFIGEERAIYRIARADVRNFARALTELPINYKQRFPNKTLPEGIKANSARATPFATLSAKTINDKYLSRLSSLFNWSVKNDALPDNPAAGVKIEAVKARVAPRVNFSPDDLTRIFGEHFQRPFGEFEWAILVSLFAGTRASETAQIKLDSIRHERGILVFRIEEETKNLNSQRVIPVHDTLIKLGIEDHVKALRTAGQMHLFPEWYRKGVEAKERAARKTLNLHFPRFLPRRFNVTYLPSVGIVDGRKTWHSLRHTFRTALELAGVEKAVADKLTGHADASMAAVYTHATSIENLKTSIDRITFDGFQLN